MISDFHFLRPYWFLALIPLALLLWQYRHRRYSSRTWQSVCDAGLLPHILIGSNQRQRQWPMMLLALVAMLAITSLAGPVWKQLEQPVFREQSALVIVLDLSRSMDAGDLKPSRLARARHKVNDILMRRQEGQTALVVYAGDAHVVSPLTQDSATIVNLAKTLTTELMPVQGSRTDKALELSIKLLKQSGVAAGNILLITDGVVPDRVDAMSVLVGGRGHQLSVLGVGTAQGAPISMAGGGYLKDRSGSIVLPRLNPIPLRRLAGQTGGHYRSLSPDDSDLDVLLAVDSRPDFDRQTEDTSLITDRWREEGPWLLLVILPFAALAFRRGYLVLVVVIILPLFPHPALALEWDELWSRPDQQAARALQQGDGAIPAADIFNDPAWQAAAHYRSGQYEQAIMALQHAATADDLYNKANALARLGRLDEAVASYDQALQQAQQQSQWHEDAHYNRGLVQQQLDKKNEEQQQDQPSSGDAEDGQEDEKNSDEGNESDGSTQDSDNESSGDEQAGSSDEQGDGSRAGDDKQGDDESSSETDAQPLDKEQDGDEQGDVTAEQGRKDDNQVTTDDLKKTEIMQANEQWLRRIPDDPGGLLRKKFLYEYQRKQLNKQAIDESSPW